MEQRAGWFIGGRCRNGNEEESTVRSVASGWGQSTQADKDGRDQINEAENNVPTLEDVLDC